MPKLSAPPARLGAAPRSIGYADRAEAERARDRARASGNNLRHLYSGKRWRDLRIEILMRAGWTCQGCAEPHMLAGKHPGPNSLVIDHIAPHRGNLVLFWDEANLQAVRNAYHDTEKQRQEYAEAARSGPGGGFDP